MLQRSRRSLAVATVAAATVAAAGVSAAIAAPGATTASAAPRKSNAGTTSTHIAAAFGGYPLHITTLTDKVVGPLQISVSKRYGVLVGDSGTSRLDQVLRHGALRTLVKGPQPGDVAGVDVSRSGAIAYTSTNYKTGVAGLTILRRGHKPVFANLSAFEKKHNPDKVVHFGLDNPTQCQLDALKPTGIPASYTGAVDSHPYAVAAVHGGWVVADAGGNDLLFVDGRGHVRLLTLLPRQPHTVTATEATALHLAPCLVGATYNFEPVPTDVEVGRDGALYITTLPGGPEGTALGARGSVYRFAPHSHHLRRLATGFAGATNLALTTSGRILVTEYFAGRISTISRGYPSTVLSLPHVASVEFYCHALYAGVTGPAGENGFTGKGKVVKIDVRW